MVSGSGTPKTDNRGKHDNRPNRTESSIMDDVRNHINSFPKYESHYSRKDNIGRKYLGSELSINTMYDLYVAKCTETDTPTASRDCYRRTFCCDFNLGFAAPKTDTCKTCCAAEIQVKACADSNDRKKLDDEWSLHKQQAQKAFEMLHNDTVISAESSEKQLTLAFDLQQTLPTPKLSVGPAYYCRKIMTYNIGIHNCGTNTATMMLWPETVAGRGSEEIASCLLKYFNTVNSPAKKMVLYSDNCCRQNKNYTVMSLWRYLIRTGKFDEIIHIFPISGHTMLPCDRDFGQIEKVLRKHEHIYTPEEYGKLIARARHVNPFPVVHMDTNDFVTFKSLAACTTNKKVTVTGEKVEFRKATQFRFCKDSQNMMYLRYTHDENETWQAVNVQKRGRQHTMTNVKFNLKYKGQRAIAKNKHDDVQKLLQYVPPVYHAFYDSIVSGENVTETNDVLDFEVSEVSEDD